MEGKEKRKGTKKGLGGEREREEYTEGKVKILYTHSNTLILNATNETVCYKRGTKATGKV